MMHITVYRHQLALYCLALISKMEFYLKGLPQSTIQGGNAAVLSLHC